MRWKAEAGCFYQDDQLAASLINYQPFQDEIQQVEDGVFHIFRTFSVEDMTADRLTLEVASAATPVFYEIPCVTYNGNMWGSGVEPQGLSCNGQPWVYASHRSSIPGCTYSETEQFSICLFGDLDNPPFSMSLAEKNGKLGHRLLLPQLEEPVRYTAKAQWEAPFRPKLHINGSIKLSGWLVLTRTGEKGLAIQKAMDLCTRLMGHPVFPRLTTDQIWDLGIQFARESVYFEEKDFKGFCMGLYYDAGAWCQRRNVLEIGWVGQNALMAVSLIRHGLTHQQSEILQQGIAVLDCWQRARLSNGLFRCRFDRVQTNPEPLPSEKEDAANLYSVVVQYLEAWRLVSEHGISRKEWRETALDVCRFAMRSQLEDGSFPRAWYADGKPAEKDGTAGAYIAWALMAGWHETGDQDMLLAAQKSFDCYDQRFQRDGYMTAGALDTLCIDKESGMPMFGLALDLYEATKDPYYLQRAEAISTYLETWMYHYSVDFPRETLLGAFAYDTLGGTSVSTQHQHIDAYAVLMVPVWVRLARLTGRKRYCRLAWEAWCNATQFISDGNMIIDGIIRPAGSQDEGVCQTWWHTSRGEFRHTSRWLVCWNDAFRLDALADQETCRMLQKMENECRRKGATQP